LPLSAKSFLRVLKLTLLQSRLDNTGTWLDPLEVVANVIPPKVYNSSEIFVIHCALGYSRLFVLRETGQVLHGLDTSTGGLWLSLLRFGRSFCESEGHLWSTGGMSANAIENGTLRIILA
jgi:hypothetical protein